MTLGSLFDGSGGFPLAGMINGIQPVWASEVEAYPIRVTSARIPCMKHLGDVTKINGAEIEPVDVITFGSPCQDLSVAGAQKGIHEGERSSLFFEAVRIIKEMRASDRAAGRTDEHVRPRFAVWENVPAHSQATQAETSKPCSKPSAGSAMKPFLFLNLRKGSGLEQAASWEKATALPGVRMTLNTGESPSVAKESTLSQILEANVPEKYFLSAKACAGILRRAEKRGKELPPRLKEALQEVVTHSTCSKTPSEEE